ncbi:MAG: PD40 domain-containing protein [Acidobacteria bacterium]|nr:PD40 domain-containing protein [Acidobacteriota bacterium]
MRLIAALIVILGALVPAASELPAFQAPGLVRSRLEWVDRTGTPISSLGMLADYGTLELSPDGKQVAVAILDSGRAAGDVWLYDAESGSRTRLTATPEDENWQIWSPDGRQIMFNRFSRESLGLYQKVLAGDGVEDLVLDDDVAKWPVSWSPDGRYVLYVTSSTRTGNDIWALPLFGDKKPFVILQTAAQENWPSFSPDGQWIAFSSTESGRAEVYLTSFPGQARKLRVSSSGGFQARWRRDGKELFYLAANGTLTAAPLKRQGSGIEAGAAESLFHVEFPYANFRAYDVAPDGKRFLVNTLVSRFNGIPRIAHLR